MFILDRIRQTAEETPDKLAAVFNGAPLGYGAFWRAIAACRRALAAQALIPGVVLIWADSALESWVIALAARSLGHDVGGLRDLEYLSVFDRLEIAGVATLETDAARSGAAIPGIRRIAIPAMSRAAADAPAFAAAQRPGGHILVTSGVTGEPKKVLSRHGESAATVEDRRGRYTRYGAPFPQPGPDTVISVFNMSLWSGASFNWPTMIWSLGGAVVFEQTAAWWRALAWPGLTHAVVTPWHLGQLMDLDPSAFIARPHLQLMVTAGALTPALAAETVRRLTPNILIDVASTETSIWAAALARSPDDLRWQAPFDDRPVEVVDEAGAPVEPGRYGIVRMRTKAIDPLAYLGDPAATAAAFKDGWFYPGDLGILRADGRLSLQGRNADVIVAAGEKRPAAIWEQALQERLACEAVCLVSGAFASGVEELHVFVETRRPIPSAELAAAVRETLVGFAEYRVHPVASLPRTPTGKVRRLALTQMLIEGAFAVDGTRRY